MLNPGRLSTKCTLCTESFRSPSVRKAGSGNAVSALRVVEVVAVASSLANDLSWLDGRQERLVREDALPGRAGFGRSTHPRVVRRYRVYRARGWLMISSLAGSERVRRLSRHRTRSASQCGVSCGPRA